MAQPIFNPAKIREALEAAAIDTADPEPDQEEMDKLASILTTAVLQLRAGDMDGARKTLGAADYLCDIRVSAIPAQIAGHFADAMCYGVRVWKTTYQPTPDWPPLEPPRQVTATEVQLRQREAQARISAVQEEFLKHTSSIDVLDFFTPGE